MDGYIDRNQAIKNAVGALKGVSHITAVDVATALEETPTADVVPKSEVERLEAEVERLKHILDCYALQYGTVMDKYIVIERARAEVAREIFAEIESAKVSIGDFKIKTFKIISLGEVAEQTITGDVVAFSDIAELKKKYTEGVNERSRS